MQPMLHRDRKILRCTRDGRQTHCCHPERSEGSFGIVGKVCRSSAYIRSGASTPIRYRATFSTWRAASVSSRRAARVPGSFTITLFS